MRLTDKQIYMYLGETAEYSNRDAYASDITMSVYNAVDDNGELINPTEDIDPAFVEQVARLWDVARLPFRDLLAAFGLSQTECSHRFCIGLKTVQRWCSMSDNFRRECAPYLRLMMAELIGYLDIRA